MKTGTILTKQKNLIIILAILALAVAAMCIVFPLVFRQELNTVMRYTQYGDEAEVLIVDTATGRSIKGDIEAIRKGEAKNSLSLEEKEGDVLYTFRKNDVKISYQPYIFPEVALEDIKEVSVTNSYGTFEVYNDGKGNFFIRGAERNLYNKQPLAELLLQARYMLSDMYVENPTSASDYGLTKDTFSAKIEVTQKDGKKHVVYVGDKEISGSRYYMKHTEKEQIYVMDSGVESFFYDVKYYLSPVVLRPIEEQQRNYIEKFVFAKNGERFFECEIIPDAERVGVLSNQLHRMTYPSEAHVLNTTTLYEMFSKVGGLAGMGVIEYGVSAKDNKDELFAAYGLDAPVAVIEFSLSGNSYSISVGKEEILDGESCFYVYSTYQDTVVLVSGAELDFLGYEIVDLFQENVFQYNITAVSSVELKYGGKNVKYVLSGEGNNLTVKEELSGKEIDVPSFRQFYISLLSVTIGGYSSVEGTASDTRKHELTFTVTLDGGEKIVFEFYGESTMSCHMIIDGKGGFKTDRKWIENIISNSDRLLDGQEIASVY